MPTSSNSAAQPSPVEAMIAALSIEIAAVRARHRGVLMPVEDGHRVEASGETVLYRFTYSGSASVPDDTRVTLQVDGTRYVGTVVSVRRATTVVALSVDLGERIERAEIVVDNAWLLVRLQERLRQVSVGEGQGSRRMAQLVTGERLPRIGRRDPAPEVLDGQPLNEEQDDALRLALGSEILHLWGPPGTGKTATLERIIEAHYRSGRSVLVVAPTNAAVDLLLGRVVERLACTDAVDRGHIVRVGPIGSPDLRHCFGNRIGLGQLVASRQQAMLSNRAALLDHANAFENEAASLYLGLRCDPDIACGGGSVKLAAEIEELCSSARELRRRADSLVTATHDLASEIVARARVVATTVHRAYLPGQIERTFDVVVIDEAGMVGLPTAYVAAARATQQVVLAGDFRQLPTIVTSRAPDVARWVERDAFAAARIPEMLERGEATPTLVALRTQHRMDEGICRLLNAVVYTQAPLRTHRDVHERAPLDSPWGTATLLIVDLSALRPAVTIPAGSQSRINRISASVVRWLVTELAEFGGIPVDADDADGVAVVTPFRAQVQLLRRKLPSSLYEQSFEVSTVHRFQGAERGTMIIDLVDGRGPTNLSRFLTATQADDSGARLLNVALSRARRRVIVVGDFEYLAGRNAPGRFTRALLDYVMENAQRIHLPSALMERARADAMARALACGDRARRATRPLRAGAAATPSRPSR